MIEFSNGHQLDFACGSGALAFDGCGWAWEWPFRWAGALRPQDMTVVAKTVTMEPRKGNLSWFHPWTCFRLLPFGNAVNAIGLTNPGIEHWATKQYPVAKNKGYKIAASIMPNDPKEAEKMASLLKPLDLAYVEVNVSCPNLEEGHAMESVLHTLHCVGECKHPVVVKLSYEQAMNDSFVLILSEESRIEAVHAINTVPWETIYGEDAKSPLKKHTGVNGGISGPKIFHSHTAKAVANIKSKSPQMKIIGGGGISKVSDCRFLSTIGASAFSIGTLFIRNPTAPNRLIKEYRKTNKDVCDEAKSCDVDGSR